MENTTLQTSSSSQANSAVSAEGPQTALERMKAAAAAAAAAKASSSAATITRNQQPDPSRLRLLTSSAAYADAVERPFLAVTE